MKSIPVVKVPETYTEEQIAALEAKVYNAIRQNGVIVVPENVEIIALPVND